MNVKVLELGETLYDGDATSVVLPSADGEMCLLPNHISIITALKPGVIKIFRSTGERIVSIKVNEGICSFSNNSAVFIL